MKKVKKDPNAVLDYLIDFKAKTNGRGISDYLQTGEELGTATVVSDYPTELVVNSFSLGDTNSSVTFWLSGGTVGKTYTVTTHITTTLGRQDDISILVQMVNK